MNWQMTRPGKVRFEKGEPFCFFTLIEDKKLEAVKPTLRLLSANPPLHREFSVWAESRGDFNRRLNDGEAEAMRQRWQRHYMKGQNVATGDGAPHHVTKRRLHAPRQPLPGLGE
jgi:hypothetical protein